MRLHNPGNHLLRIDALWAFVSTDADGNEGLCAAPLQGMTMPMIAADEKRLASLIPMAEQLATISGMTIRLVKLSTREELREFRP
jgi:hypothetical protein